MSTSLVRYTVEKPARFTRLQLLVRLVAFMALGLCGISLGAIYFAAFVGLPAFAAARLAGQDPDAYLREDAPRLVRALRWFASIYGYFGLVSDTLPRQPDETVHLEIDVGGRPTAASAFWRVLLGVPAAIVLAFLGCLAGLVWLWSAFRVLVSQRVGDGAFSFLRGVQRFSLRLLAYQASLVDEYPRLGEAPPELPRAHGAV